MKKVFSVFLVLNLTLMLIACVSAGSSQSKNAKTEGNRPLIGEILEKKLVGTGKSSGDAFIFHQDYTLTVIKGEKKYTGSWKFDKKAPLYPFQISWQEGGEHYGYIVDFVNDSDQWALIGHWTVSDAYITLSFKFTTE